MTDKEVSGWIPVQDLLPRTDEMVLTWDGHGVSIGTCYEDGRWHDYVGMDAPDYEIMHWQPLPEPPCTT